MDPTLPTSSPSSPSPAQPTGGFRLGFDAWNWRNWLIIAALLMALMGGTIFVLTRAPSDPANEDGAAYALGSAVGAYLGSLLCVGVVPGVLLLFARAGRDGRRSRGLHTAAGVVAVCLGLLFLVGTSVGAAKRMRAESRAESDRAFNEMDELKKEIAEKRERGEMTEGDLNRVAAASDKAAASMTGAGKPLAELMRQFNAHLLENVRPVVKAQEEFMKAGGLTVDATTNKESLSARMAMVKGNRRIALETAERLKGLEAKVDELAAANKVVKEQAARFKTNTLGNGQAGRIVRIRELDADIYRYAEQYFTILHDHFGKWKSTDDGLVFDDDRVAAAFNAVVEPLHAASEEQMALMRVVSEGAKTPPEK